MPKTASCHRNLRRQPGTKILELHPDLAAVANFHRQRVHPPRGRTLGVGDPALEKEAWVSGMLLEWGSCGKLVQVDGATAGYVLYAPPAYVP